MTVVTLIAATNAVSDRANMLVTMRIAVMVGTIARRSTLRGLVADTAPAIALMHVDLNRDMIGRADHALAVTDGVGTKGIALARSVL